MARKHNPFAEAERATLETPWGEFTFVAPNKARMVEIQSLAKEGEALKDTDVETSIDLGMRAAAAAVENGEELLEKLRAAWDAGDVTIATIRRLAEIVGAEMSDEAEGND